MLGTMRLFNGRRRSGGVTHGGRPTRQQQQHGGEERGQLAHLVVDVAVEDGCLLVAEGHVGDLRLGEWEKTTFTLKIRP